MEQWTVRSVAVEEVEDDWLDGFERYQKIGTCLCYQGDNLITEDRDGVDDWLPEEKREKVQYIRESLQHGGSLIGAFQGGDLVGFGLLDGRVIHEAVELDKLHVSRPYRRMGIGRLLFMALCDEAVRTGAKWMFISSHVAAESQRYYRALGCEDGRDLLEWFSLGDEYWDLPLKFRL